MAAKRKTAKRKPAKKKTVRRKTAARKPAARKKAATRKPARKAVKRTVKKKTARKTATAPRARRTKAGVKVKEWTAKEIASLKKMYKGMTNVQIARKLKRTSGSIRAKAAILGEIRQSFKGDVVFAENQSYF